MGKNFLSEEQLSKAYQHQIITGTVNKVSDFGVTIELSTCQYVILSALYMNLYDLKCPYEGAVLELHYTDGLSQIKYLV